MTRSVRASCLRWPRAWAFIRLIGPCFRSNNWCQKRKGRETFPSRGTRIAPADGGGWEQRQRGFAGGSLMAGGGDQAHTQLARGPLGKDSRAAEAAPLCRSISDAQGGPGCRGRPQPHLQEETGPRGRGRPCCTWLGCGLLSARIAVALRGLVGSWAGTRSTAVLKMHGDMSSGWRSGEGGARAWSRRVAGCVTLGKSLGHSGQCAIPTMYQPRTLSTRAPNDGHRSSVP